MYCKSSVKNPKKIVHRQPQKTVDMRWCFNQQNIAKQRQSCFAVFLEIIDRQK